MTPAVAATPSSPGPMMVRHAVDTSPTMLVTPKPKDALAAAIGKTGGAAGPSTLDRITRGTGVTITDGLLFRRPPARGRIATIRRPEATEE